MTKAEITEKLCVMLGAEKVLWLPRGIYGDETNEHVDNVCAFTAPGKVVLAWTDNENDPQYALSKACADYLEQQTDAKGRKLEVTQLPIPQTPVCAAVRRPDGQDCLRDPGGAVPHTKDHSHCRQRNSAGRRQYSLYHTADTGRKEQFSCVK